MRRVQRGVEAGDPGVEVADLAGEHERLLGLDRQAPITVGVADQELGYLFLVSGISILIVDASTLRGEPQTARSVASASGAGRSTPLAERAVTLRVSDLSGDKPSVQRSLSSSRRARLVTPHKLGATQPPEPIRAKTSWSPGWRQDSSASCRWSPSQGVTGKEELLVDC